MTLKGIAEMTGTSVSTVSRVLNRTSSTCASKELQDQIWEAARQTGYVPNAAARSLRKPENPQEKVPAVTIVMARFGPHDEEPFFAELLTALEAELMKQRVQIRDVIYARDSLPADFVPDGGVIILGRCSKELLTDIHARTRSVVGIWRNPTDFDVDEVMCDGQKAAELAIGYLLSLGHRRIAYIGSCTYESRYIGYCDMMIRNHIPLDYGLVKETDQTRAEAETAVRQLLELKRTGQSDFSAIFCANDNTAVRVLEVLEGYKKELKRNPVSVISIDDIDAAEKTRPYLTTVHIPRTEMAHMAVLILLDRMAGGHREVIRNEFPCRIVRRMSCYPCSAGPNPGAAEA